MPFEMYRFLCFILLLFVLECSHVSAQSKYWVYFKDKGTTTGDNTWVSDRTLRNRHMLHLEVLQRTDLPVFQPYVNNLRHFGAVVVCQSKWLNAVSVYANSVQLEKIKKLDFVCTLEPIVSEQYPATYGDILPAHKINNYALEQTHAYDLTKSNLTGKKVAIGIIDGKFFQADRNRALVRIFKEGRMMGIRNFIDSSDKNFFTQGSYPQDIHATVVWQLIAGYDAETKTQYGVATDARFYLATTDKREKEYHQEEDYWIAALEWMDSLGVRLIHSSICYAMDFDDPSENYKPEEMDGMTTAVSKAAKIAAEEKGLIIVVSAGNAGKIDNWRIVKAPADVESVISVGATLVSGARAKSSSIGSEKVNFLKPDLVCFSQGGTSLSAPIVTGIAACLLQQDSTLSPSEIKSILTRSANLYSYPNNFVGYGIPSAETAVEILQNRHAEKAVVKNVHAKRNEYKVILKKYPSAFKSKEAVIYHKKNSSSVIGEDIIPIEKKSFVVTRMEGCIRSTLILGDHVTEIFWRN